MQRESTQWLIPAVLAIGAAGALWYYWTRVSRPTPESLQSVAPAPLAPQPEPLAGPRHPIPAIERSDAPKLRPLPPLDESDEYFKMEIVDLYGRAVDDVLVVSGLIERLVATVDNLPRSHVAERIRPVGRLQGQFRIDGQDESGSFTLSRDNYRRYDILVGLVAAADMDQLVDTYHRFYPLFQKAYVDLGYPDGYFNDRLVEVIDHLLVTPESGGHVQLVRPHVLYEYEDPALESLSSGQKLLLRMGDDNAATIKQVLRELRERIVEA